MLLLWCVTINPSFNLTYHHLRKGRKHWGKMFPLIRTQSRHERVKFSDPILKLSIITPFCCIPGSFLVSKTGPGAVLFGIIRQVEARSFLPWMTVRNKKLLLHHQHNEQHFSKKAAAVPVCCRVCLYCAVGGSIFEEDVVSELFTSAGASPLWLGWSGHW